MTEPVQTPSHQVFFVFCGTNRLGPRHIVVQESCPASHPPVAVKGYFAGSNRLETKR
jgi:hypothetical protein